MKLGPIYRLPAQHSLVLKQYEHAISPFTVRKATDGRYLLATEAFSKVEVNNIIEKISKPTSSYQIPGVTKV